MAYEDEDYDDQEYDELDEDMEDELDEDLEEDDDDNTEMVAGVSGWTISIIVHGLILLVLGAIVIAAQLEKEKPPIRVATLEAPEEVEKEEPEERTVEEVEVEIDAEEIVEDPIVTDLDVPEEVTETEDEEVTEVEEPKGREEAVSDAEAGGAAAFMAIGAGGGAKGAMGNRSGGGRKRAVGRNGGSRRSESAVEAALRWFKRHQSPNGMWDVDGYPDNCTDNPKCEPGSAHTDSEGDVACTAYALMCFLGAGYDHKTPSKFRNTVQNGLDWLKAQAGPGKTKGVADGLMFGGTARGYSNAVATYALCEAYGMTMDPGLKDTAQGALSFIVASQNKDANGYGLGWNYTPSPKRNDGSVSGWAIMAAKAGTSAGLASGNSMEGAKIYLERAWKAENPNWESLDPYGESGFPYTYDPTNETVGKGGKGTGNGKLACVGALGSVFLGHTAGDIMLETLCNRIMSKDFPGMTSYPCNTYYMYYDTLAIFQVGGERWKTWNNGVRDMLVGSQKKKGSGCFDGSWDYEGTRFHGHETGRLLSTAYCCLCLEVYYRYARMADLKH